MADVGSPMDELRRLSDAATPGEWRMWLVGVGQEPEVGTDSLRPYVARTRSNRADAEFIAAAANFVRAAIEADRE